MGECVTKKNESMAARNDKKNPKKIGFSPQNRVRTAKCQMECQKNANSRFGAYGGVSGRANAQSLEKQRAA